MTRYIFVTDVESGDHVVVTDDTKQANDLLAQYNDPCNFDGMAHELIPPAAFDMIDRAIDHWHDYGGTVYQIN